MVIYMYFRIYYMYKKPTNITEFLYGRGYFIFEGYCELEQSQVKDLILLSNTPGINVMEIGFNAGHSAEVFLKNNSTLTLTSFDLGSHNYVLIAKEYIDLTYPNRHTLIIGDSTITVPKYIKNNKNTKFDIIFIDGGHDYKIANTDLTNCMKLAHNDTIVIIDDTIYTKGWDKSYTTGPTVTWLQHQLNNKIIEINKKDYRPGHGMSWGKYNIC